MKTIITLTLLLFSLYCNSQQIENVDFFLVIISLLLITT